MNASRIYGQEQGYKAAEQRQLPSDDDETELEEDAEAGHHTILRLLLLHGADIDPRKGLRSWCRGNRYDAYSDA